MKGTTDISLTPLIARKIAKGLNASNREPGAMAIKRGYFLRFVLRFPGTEPIPLIELFTPVFPGCQQECEGPKRINTQIKGFLLSAIQNPGEGKGLLKIILKKNGILP